MDFNGFQKLTLLDFPGKVACTLFLGGCNFRCPFCHNASLVTKIDNSQLYKEEEVLSFLKKRVGVLEGVCVTGGEPLLREDLGAFLKKVKDLGFLVKLDTNGSFPERLEGLISDGLVDYVAMDIKNSPEKYGKTIGLEGFDMTPIFKSVELLKNGTLPYEFRTTLVKEFHEFSDIEKIGKWISPSKRYFLQSFVDSGDIICDGLHEIDKQDIEKMKEIASRFVPNAEIRGIQSKTQDIVIFGIDKAQHL